MNQRDQKVLEKMLALLVDQVQLIDVVKGGGGMFFTCKIRAKVVLPDEVNWTVQTVQGAVMKGTSQVSDTVTLAPEIATVPGKTGWYASNSSVMITGCASGQSVKGFARAMLQGNLTGLSAPVVLP